MFHLEEACNNLYDQFRIHLNEAIEQSAHPLRQGEAAVTVCLQYLKQLRQLVLTNGFADAAEEIHFFKHQKPRFLSQFIYYSEVAALYSKWPNGSMQSQKVYIETALDRLSQFFINNKEFYVYHRFNEDSLDQRYYLRSQEDWRSGLVNGDQDFDFCTGHSTLLAKVIAYDRLQQYLQERLDHFGDDSEEHHRKGFSPMPWTGSKTALIEVIRSFHAKGVIRDGKVSIAELTQYFEFVFAIDLSDSNRLWSQICNRKNDSVIFLKTLVEILQKMIEQAE